MQLSRTRPIRAGAWARFHTVLLLALHNVTALGDGLEIEFASVPAARAVLGTRDAFVQRLSPFDRAARLKTERDVTEEEYLAFVMQAPVEWTREERRRVAQAFEDIEPTLSVLLPALEEPILLVKTSGLEEGGAAYTRGDAIVLPRAYLDRPRRALQRTLAHEIFHIVSRSNAALKRSLYQSIGFQYCGEIEVPPPLGARKITNPDAPINDHCIRLLGDGKDGWFVPVLSSREPRYDPALGLEFFAYLSLALLEVERSDAADSARAVIRDGGPVLVPLDRVSGFYEQVGRNTEYVIHPEEILAENFAMLVLGETDVPSPNVLSRVRDRLSAASGAAGSR